MKFRKKPVVIEATQWFKDGDHPKVEICWFDDAGRIRWAPGDSNVINIYGCTQRPAIRTLEGWHEVTPGDWIITGVKGEHYPCKPDIFAATYGATDSAGVSPLSDEQINEVAAQIWGNATISPQSCKAFARAIESAHGIKS